MRTLRRMGLGLGSILAHHFLLLLDCWALPLWVDFPLAAIFLLINLLIQVLPAYERDVPARLQILWGGRELLLTAAWLTPLDIGLSVVAGVTLLPNGLPVALFVADCVVMALGLCLLVLNGALRILCASRQVGWIQRLLVIFLWWLPIANVVWLYQICRVARMEYQVEREKEALNRVRQESSLCSTRYPILLVHGVFFRDTRFFNYWGRIPQELKRNGARLYYGQQQSALSVADSAKELKQRVFQLLRESGCQKVNILAHSKGGLDARYAISCLGLAPYVASLTTINTPHRGCRFADHLLTKLPNALVQFVAKRYNTTLRRFGEANPDFLAAVGDLTHSRCTQLNERMPDQPEVWYQSVASCMHQAGSAKFPLNWSYRLVKRYDGANDGLVGVDSAPWGHFLGLLTSAGRRGISHGDMIDLDRRNFRGFDVREFYVHLVAGLKRQGY